MCVNYFLLSAHGVEVVGTHYDNFTKKIDTSYVEAAVKEVLEVCPDKATIVIESTVSPGIIEKI